VEPTIYGVKYPSNLVQNVKVNDKYVAAVSTNDKVFNRHSATLSDAKPFVNNLTVNHASLPACRFAHSGTLNSNIDNSYENFTRTMRDLEGNLGLDRAKNSHTREIILNLGKDSNHAKTYMANDPLSFHNTNINSNTNNN
jgi:hypothetical protein